MSVDNHVRDALERVTEERAHVAGKATRFQKFQVAVRDVEATTESRPGGGPMADGGVTVTGYCGGSSSGRCEQVRSQFEELVGPILDSQPSMTETLREEFCDEIALALSPQSETRFTPGVKRAVLTAAGNRHQELRTLEKALERERESLENAAEQIEEMTSWLARADQTPLLELDFEQLSDRHERLAEFRDRCQTIARERQETLGCTTSYEGSAGIEQQGVCGYLYEDFPTVHPVLSTTTRLEELCGDCQRAVRDHLTRRV